MTEIRKRSVTINGHKTSISLEEPFWHALVAIAAEQQMPVNALIARIDAERTGNLSSAIRVHVLRHLEQHAGGRKPEAD